MYFKETLNNFLVKIIFVTGISDFHWGKIHFEDDSHKSYFKPYMLKNLSLSLSSLHNSLRVWGDFYTLAERSLLSLPYYFPNGPAFFLGQQMVSREIATGKREKALSWSFSKYKRSRRKLGSSLKDLVCLLWIRNQSKQVGDYTCLFVFKYFYLRYYFQRKCINAKCITWQTFTNWAPLCNWYPHQETEYDQHPRSSPVALPVTTLSTKGNHSPVSFVFRLCINEIICHIVFCVWSLSFFIMLMRLMNIYHVLCLFILPAVQCSTIENNLCILFFFFKERKGAILNSPNILVYLFW